MTYRDYGYPSYLAYTFGKEFARLRKRCASTNTFSKYCYVCDDPHYVVHHENYERLGDEDLKRDVVALCQTHHTQVHFDEMGQRIPLDPGTLRTRRVALRKSHLKRQLRNPDRVWPTLGRLLYRLFW